MQQANTTLPGVSHPRRFFILLLLLSVGLSASVGAKPATAGEVPAQAEGQPVWFDEGIDPQQWYRDHEIENQWKPDYLHLATGSPDLPDDHGVYAWPYALDSIGWSMQSYQDYGGTPYFHHGMDMMKIYGTQVFNRSGGQVVNIENYNPGNSLYWEVAVLDPDGYIWQYHHIDQPTIPQYIWTKYAEYQADPVNGGFIPPDTHIGNIIYWPVWSYGKQFNHIHLNILSAGGIYVNGFEFHVPLPDTVGPQIQAVGLLKYGQIYPGNTVDGEYSLYVRSRDLILDDVYYLPPWEFTFSVDGGPVHTTWRFDTLPGADRYAYLQDFYVVPPTCGDYDCRDYYVDLGFIPDSQFVFPATGGEHTIQVTVRDYAGNIASQAYTYTVIGPPAGTVIWQDFFETNQGWVTNPDGTDTATSGQWERGDPQPTYWYGPKQLGDAVSGLNDLVTGRPSGSSPTSYDIDGGVTSIRSPAIDLPVADSLTLSFRYYLAHYNTSSAADFLRVTVVGENSSQQLFEEVGAANNDDGLWEISNVNMDGFSGQTVHVLIEAADGAAESLVEAGIDNVIIVGTGINQAPVADPQSVITDEDTSLDIVLTATDPDGDVLTYTVETSPTHGTLSGDAPNLVYIPHPNYNGTDSFTFTASDGMDSSSPAVVDVLVAPVNDAPVADSQPVKTRQSMPVAITLTGWDLDGDPLTYSVVTYPVHGTLGGSAPDLVYTPNASFAGTDSFTFIVNDGEFNSNQALVNILVDFAFLLPVVSR